MYTHNVEPDQPLGKKELNYQLKILYGARCLLTNLPEYQLTQHHIVKREHGGPNTVANCALITKQLHRWLHMVEYYDYELYQLVNECLVIYKELLDYRLLEYAKIYEEEIMPLYLAKIKK